jgi:hypothetical protein
MAADFLVAALPSQESGAFGLRRTPCPLSPEFGTVLLEPGFPF